MNKNFKASVMDEPPTSLDILHKKFERGSNYEQTNTINTITQEPGGSRRAFSSDGLTIAMVWAWLATTAMGRFRLAILSIHRHCPRAASLRPLTRLCRRRLSRAPAVFLPGVRCCFPIVSQIYRRSTWTSVLVFFGALFFVALAHRRGPRTAGARRRYRRELESAQGIYMDFIPLPGFCAATVTLEWENWTRKKKVAFHPTIVDRRYNIAGIVRALAACLSILAGGDRRSSAWPGFRDYDRFRPGDSVVVVGG